MNKMRKLRKDESELEKGNAEGYLLELYREINVLKKRVKVLERK